jgi:hypothetical protein
VKIHLCPYIKKIKIKTKKNSPSLGDPRPGRRYFFLI